MLEDKHFYIRILRFLHSFYAKIQVYICVFHTLIRQSLPSFVHLKDTETAYDAHQLNIMIEIIIFVCNHL